MLQSLNSRYITYLGANLIINMWLHLSSIQQYHHSRASIELFWVKLNFWAYIILFLNNFCLSSVTIDLFDLSSNHQVVYFENSGASNMNSLAGQ